MASKLLVLGVLALAVRAQGQAPPLNVAGDYMSTSTQTCTCWNSSEPTCKECVQSGCSYVSQVSMTSPNKNGFFNLSISGSDEACWKGQEGPFQAHVDQCGHIVGGVLWDDGYHAEKIHFDPNALDQDMHVIYMGDVLGFHGGSAGFRHSVIMRHNITICDTKSFLEGTCTPGKERFVCMDLFNVCSGGDCAGKNRDLVSPPNDEFFARLSTTALNGTYTLITEKSSKDCPTTISAYHFGTQLGLGWSRTDMHLTRVQDISLSSELADCIQFSTICSGLQLHFTMAFAGQISREGDNLHMSMFMMRANDEDELINVDKCEFRAVTKAPEMVRIVVSKEGAVIALSIFLTIFILAAAGLGCCCLSYRRRYIESKIDRAYDVFQNPT